MSFRIVRFKDSEGEFADLVADGVDVQALATESEVEVVGDIPLQLTPELHGLVQAQIALQEAHGEVDRERSFAQLLIRIFENGQQCPAA